MSETHPQAPASRVDLGRLTETVTASVRNALGERPAASRVQVEKDERFFIDYVRDLTRDADCVIVVPPFANALLPPLGPHVLQSLAQAEGMVVRVFYANLLFAAMLDLSVYQSLCEMRSQPLLPDEGCGVSNRQTADAVRTKPDLVGERIFARLAHGLPRFGLKSVPNRSAPVSSAPLVEAESRTDALCEIFTAGIVEGGCSIIGFSTSFQQTNACFAMMRALRRTRETVCTLLGGANCEDPMGRALLALGADSIDFVFSGESEESFPRVLRAILDGQPPRERLIEGKPCLDLDALPVPSFADYFLQLRTLFPSLDLGESWLTYETSRGCWWGQKHHCTFCGLNGQTMAFRAKSPEKVIADLRTLLVEAPTSSIAMADNIMPHSYHATLVPRLVEEKFPAKLFYEQKANLNLRQVKRLYDAGITAIQPGIEALSTGLLKRIKKGVSASQNLALLRYARVFGMTVAWNLLSELPGDSAEEFEWTLKVLPLLRHLHPPGSLSPLSIDRFSPYFEDPAHFEITRTRPWPAYRDIFPGDAEVEDLAYHFEGDYRSGSRESPQLLAALDEAVTFWRGSWERKEQPLPALMIVEIDSDNFCLMDTREEERSHVMFLGLDQARATLIAGPLDRDQSKWAIAEGFAVALDGRCTPLATASYETMSKFETPNRASVLAA
jgi:ribosomal peptide maturation radical SAM protein 1